MPFCSPGTLNTLKQPIQFLRKKETWFLTRDAVKHWHLLWKEWGGPSREKNRIWVDLVGKSCLSLLSKSSLYHRQMQSPGSVYGLGCQLWQQLIFPRSGPQLWQHGRRLGCLYDFDIKEVWFPVMWTMASHSPTTKVIGQCLTRRQIKYMGTEV